MSAAPIYSLIFEGGGVKGLCHIGALKELSKRGALDSVTRYAGTSIGGIIACFLAMGMSIEELEQIALNLDIRSLKESNSIFSKVYNLCVHGGLYKKRKMRAWLARMIKHCGFEVHTTLQQHYNTTKRELVICTTKLNMQRPVYLHHAKFPNVTLLDAMCMTASFPFYYTYEKMGDDTFVDGGVCDNYPFWIFNDMQRLYQGDIDGIDSSYMDSTSLGMKILSPHESNSMRVYNGNDRITSVLSVVNSIVNTLFTQIERSGISQSCIDGTIGIHSGSVSALDFNIIKATREFLILSGVLSTERYMDKRMRLSFSEYV